MKLLIFTFITLVAAVYAIEDYTIQSPHGFTRVYQERVVSPLWNQWNANARALTGWSHLPAYGGYGYGNGNGLGYGRQYDAYGPGLQYPGLDQWGW
ncbi:unnamed protein product [Oppiella nova]|uniref:Uncharacterized protein n=1 Tax=Oppiella nova TaxID=334625 RepID=A0A7R9MAJ2_9ACAR|nr:unnamed protein product [Oppiella nova]CAG2173638.1 unnamed protein product [Oppiella nova]